MKTFRCQELALIAKHLSYIESQPLPDRKSAKKAWYNAIKNEPAMVAERIAWLIVGNYGYGAYSKAQDILSSKGNKVAQFAILIAALEYGCPARMAIEAWKELSKAEQKRINKAIGGIKV